MLSVYALPFVLRPLDFIFNLKNYVLGFLTYMVMLPVFVNIMQVYSMSNLHDISWGNRPSASSGTNMLTIHDKKQEELKSNYMVFRVNFLAFWVIFNAGIAILVETYASKPPDTSKIINNGSYGFLEVFALYLAALVVFRVFFGGLHILKFKYFSIFRSDYKTFEFDMVEDARQLR